jgi:hypothetical protein
MEEEYWSVIDKIKKIAMDGVQEGSLVVGDRVTSPEIERGINAFSEPHMVQFLHRINGYVLPLSEEELPSRDRLLILVWDDNARSMKIGTREAPVRNA